MVALLEVAVDIVAAQDEVRLRDLMQAHHYLGAVPGIRGLGAAAQGPRRLGRLGGCAPKRIFERLRDEHGFTGGYTIVKDYVREHCRHRREMFVPLTHPPGHAQADFGEAWAVIRVDPDQLDAALRAWHETYGGGDSALAIDGKTLRGAIDDDGKQAHVLGIVGHDSKAPWGQKKSA